jgi:hypothetical protein
MQTSRRILDPWNARYRLQVTSAIGVVMSGFHVLLASLLFALVVRVRTGIHLGEGKAGREVSI